MSEKCETILAFGSHPDDLESGIGGILLRHRAEGLPVNTVLLTAEPASRLAEAEAAAGILDVQMEFLNLREGHLWEAAGLVTAVCKSIEKTRPQRIYVHWPLDFHPDHQACGMAVFRAWLELVEEFRPRLFCYETVLGHQTYGFHPTHHVDVTGFVDRKKRAVLCHASQQPESTFYPTHEAMMKLRGLESGCACAEALVEIFHRPSEIRDHYPF